MKIKILKQSLTACMITLATTVYAGDIIHGKTKSAACAGCHGANGIGLSQEFPNLAGQKEAYIIKQLTAFKNGTRKDPTMAAMTAALTNTDMQDLAAYFSSLGITSAVSSTPEAKTSMAMAKATKNEFPETTFITMKKSAVVETFPSGNHLGRWSKHAL